MRTVSTEKGIARAAALLLEEIAEHSDEFVTIFGRAPETNEEALMLLLNYAHPITDAQRVQIEALTGQSITRLLELPNQIDPQQPLAPQVVALVDAAGLTPQQWQSESILVNLPSLNFSAAVLLAELHGRMGYFPPVLRLRPVPGTTPPRFEVAEILNLQVIRDEARGRR
ncbi:MAG: CRISPR-associated protein Csx15 [Roseiflexaceae bacterium]|nr:CRISPR-associated protein Csx15 [Roseiflexaceae bacterium]